MLRDPQSDSDSLRFYGLCKSAYPHGVASDDVVPTMLLEAARGAPAMDTRCGALLCLSHYDRDVARTTFLAALAVAGTRGCTLWALGYTRDRLYLPILASYSDDPSSEVREAAVHGLSELETPEILPILHAISERDAELFPRVSELARTGWRENGGQERRPEVAERELSALGPAVVRALARRDMRALAAMVHPARGLRLGVYGKPLAEPVFSPAEVLRFPTNHTQYHFGWEDQGEAEVRLTPAAMLRKWLPGERFLHPDEIGYDRCVYEFETEEGIAWDFPDGLFVEYVHNGDGTMEDASWRALIAIFAPFRRGYRLVALVHDGWTI